MNVIVCSSSARAEAIAAVIERLQSLGRSVEVSQGAERTIILVPGEGGDSIAQALAGMEGVERVQSLSRPYRLAARELRPEGTLVSIAGQIAGSGRPLIVAGAAGPHARPPSQAFATQLKDAGVHVLRAGVYQRPAQLYAEPRLDLDALAELGALGRRLSLPLALAPRAPEDVALLARSADLLIIDREGASNQSLLRACGYVDRPLLLTRPPAALVDEWLQRADELLGRGNRQVLLAAGGIRAYEGGQLTFDLSAAPVVKRRSHLPVLADLGGLGLPAPVLRVLALAGVAAGADGLLLDVREEHAEDGVLTPAELAALLPAVSSLAKALAAAQR